MSREIVVSEAEKIAVVLENGTVREFFLSEGEQYVGDIILATVESIVPAIEAAFLNIGREKSGFIHVSDLPSSKKQQSGIRQFLKPQQQMLVQVTREPTGNKGACLTGFIQLPGRFLVLTPFERRIGLSKRIYDARERARLARIARMICGSGYGIVLRPEAVGQSEQALRDDLKILLGRWKHILAQSEKQNAGSTLYRDQDILERILREGATNSVGQIIVDDQTTYDRAMKYFGNWSDTKTRGKLRLYNGQIPVLSYYGIYQQLEKAIQPMVHLPSGGTLVIQPTEALTSIDVNTSSMTSTDNQPETILRTNCEAAEEVARQLILRDIGGVVVIDFIDMDNPRDQQIVWQKLADALHHDKAQPQISYFSEFSLVEMTRRRQRQRLSEMLTMPCPTCQGVGRIRNLLYRFDILTGEGMKARVPAIQPEEKSSRYRDGSEKSEKAEKSSSSSRQRGSSRSSSNGNKSSSSRNTRQQSENVSAPPPEKPVVEKESTKTASTRPVVEEKPEYLLFDDSIFSAKMSDEILETYIEREDNLNVSSRLAGSLDELIGRLESEGLDSIRRKPEPKDEDSDEDDEDFTSEDNTPEEDSSSVQEASEESEETVSSPPSKRGRRSTQKRSKATVAAAANDANDEQSEGDEASEAVVEESEAPSPVEVSEELNNDADKGSNGDEGEAEMDSETETSEEPVPSLSSVNLAESALTAASKSSLNSAAKPKRILSKRRTIRSFRPKR